MARISIVDDNPASALPLGRLLEFQGHSVECILRADEALDRLRTEAPDLLLLDVGMPGVNGIELLRRLRDDQRLSGTAVVMYSGLFDQALVDEARGLGAVDYLVKGTNWEGMLDRIERHLPHS